MIIEVRRSDQALVCATFRMNPHHHHGNCKVGSELVVTPGAGGSIAVFVNPPLMDQLRMLLAGVIWVMGHIEHLLKVLLDFSIPLFIGHRELFACRYNINMDTSYDLKWNLAELFEMFTNNIQTQMIGENYKLLIS